MPLFFKECNTWMDKILRCDQNEVVQTCLESRFMQLQVDPFLEIQGKRRKKNPPHCYSFWCLIQTISFYQVSVEQSTLKTRKYVELSFAADGWWWIVLSLAGGSPGKIVLEDTLTAEEVPLHSLYRTLLCSTVQCILLMYFSSGQQLVELFMNLFGQIDSVFPS